MEIISIPPLKITLKIKNNLIQRIFLNLDLSTPSPTYKIHSPTGEVALRFFMHYFFKKDNPPIVPPLNWSLITPFQKQVFITLLNHTKFGSIITYQKLAQLIGKKKAQRAVGRALNKNPWPVIIPCHRVIKKNKEIGGFSCGKEIKKLLLKHEGINCRNL